MLVILRLRRGLGACCVQLHCGTVLLTNFDLVSRLCTFIIDNKRSVGASLEDYHSRTTSKWPIARKKTLTVPFRKLFPTRVFNTGIVFHFARHQFLLLVTASVQWKTNQNHYNGIFSVSDTGYSGVEPMTSYLLVHILYHWATTDSWELGLN